MNIKLTFAACILFLSNAAYACSIQPAEQAITAKELVSISKEVSLAKVINATAIKDGNTEYTFDVIRPLSGVDKKRFVLSGGPKMSEIDDVHFNHHYSAEFWKKGRGRVTHETDCRIYPSFVVGNIYLIFHDAPYTSKSFERIISLYPKGKDKWLMYVEAHYAKNKQQ